jgi:phosphohistidine swiveling domain-containing protein
MEDRWFTDRRVGKRFPYYTRGNAADVLADPVSPLGWTFLWEGAISPGARDGFIVFGLVDWDEFETPEDPECFGLFGGYFYNPLSIVRLMGARLPGASPEDIDRAYFDPNPEIPPYVAEPWHESEQHAAKLAESLGWVMSTDALREVDEEKVLADRLREERPDLSTLNLGALLARARSLRPYLQQMFETSIWASLGASVGPGALGAITAGLGDPTLTIRLLGGIEVDSAKPSFAMWELSRLARGSDEVSRELAAGVEGLPDRLAALTSDGARAFQDAFARFVHDFGSRGPNEWDLRARTWETHPEMALAAIERMTTADDAASPTARHDEAVADRGRATAEVRERLAADAEALATFDAAMRSSDVFLPARERYKTNCIKVIGEIRACLLEVGRRMVERGALDRPDQVFFLVEGELDHFRHEPERFTDTLRQREQDFLALFELEPPFMVTDAARPLDAWTRRGASTVRAAEAGTVLSGTAGSGGVARGRARIILDPSDPFALEPGDILVTANTDPAWTPLFVPAGGVVTEIGALGSHAMIISRELGIPCVVSVRDATHLIADGVEVVVDGTRGTVTVGGA